MARCAYIKPGGQRCGATAMGGHGHCYGHREDLAEERRRNASRGGRAGGRGRGSELSEVKARLRKLADSVLAGETERADAIAAGQLLNVWLRATEVERKVRELDELEARLEALEQQREGGMPWGA